jgi:serine/threonine-protein kinase
LAYAASGKREAAIRVLDKLKQPSLQHPSLPIPIAMVYTTLGQREQALALLERAYGLRATNVVYIKVYPEFDSLRADPRFQELLRGMKLAPQ